MNPHSPNRPNHRPHYRGGKSTVDLLPRARALRKDSTSTENIVWNMLRSRKFHGLKFRRQHQIGNFIVDFYCDECKLVLEFDGPVHNEEKVQERDRAKERYLRKEGFNFLRFENRLVIKTPGRFRQELERGIEAIDSPQHPHPGPLPKG